MLELVISPYKKNAPESLICLHSYDYPGHWQLALTPTMLHGGLSTSRWLRALRCESLIVG